MPIGILGSLVDLHHPLVFFAYVLSGGHGRTSATVGLEAPVAFAITKDMHGCEWLSKSLRWAHWLGSHRVMLVMLLGQSRVFIRWRKTACCPRIFADDPSPVPHSVEEYDSGGTLAAIVGSVTPIDEIGKMVNIGTLLAFVIVSLSVMDAALYQSQPARLSYAWVPLIPILGVLAKRIYDAEPGHVELDPAGRMACDRFDRLLHLWREA